MEESRWVTVAFVVCFLSGVLVGVSYMGSRLNVVSQLLSVSEDQVGLLQAQVEVLRATVKTLQDLVKFYEDLLGITRAPPRGLPRF